MSTDPVRYELNENVAVIRIDDGKANALSHTVLDAFGAALDQAEADEARALVIIGREGKFSAGFDLSVMNQGAEQAIGMMSKGAAIALRLVDSPCPVVLGVTGHALAMGAVLLCTADERIGGEGPFKIGLNEVAIGMTLPSFALELAEARLSKRHLYRATSGAEIYSPQTAVDAGFLDAVVPLAKVDEEACARGAALANTLDPKSYQRTKRALRGPMLERLRSSA